MDENPIYTVSSSYKKLRVPGFLSWKIILVAIGLFLFLITIILYAGGESVINKKTPTCKPAPACSDIIPTNCTRGAPVFDANGCLQSCGQLNCESLQQSKTSVSCNSDSDCPKSASCVPGDSCWVYLCIEKKCTFTNVSE